MKRGAWLLVAAGPGLPAAAAAQLVPLSRCNAATPCSIPFGLRPADSVADSPYAKTGQGNTAAVSVSVGVGAGSEVKINGSRPLEDPSERAARLFLKKNPPPVRTPTPGASVTSSEQ